MKKNLILYHWWEVFILLRFVNITSSYYSVHTLYFALLTVESVQSPIRQTIGWYIVLSMYMYVTNEKISEAFSLTRKVAWKKINMNKKKNTITPTLLYYTGLTDHLVCSGRDLYRLTVRFIKCENTYKQITKTNT